MHIKLFYAMVYFGFLKSAGLWFAKIAHKACVYSMTYFTLCYECDIFFGSMAGKIEYTVVCQLFIIKEICLKEF